MTTSIQIVFYSMYGHIYTMAEAMAEGVRSVPGCSAELLQVPELMPDAVLEKYGAKAARAVFAHVPTATVDRLAEADAIIFGTPTRFGNMAAQMRNFLDQTGGLWMKGAPGRQSRQRLRQYRHPARRPGNNHYQLSYHPAASRHDHRRRTLCRTAADEHERNNRRHPLRRHHPGRGGRLPPTVGK